MEKEEYISKEQRKEMAVLSKKKQRTTKIVSLILFAVLVVVGFSFFSNFSSSEENENNAKKEKITVYYSQTCGCCAEYLSYLKKSGFEVDARQTRDMLSIKEQYQIPTEMESCHTSIVGDYFVEGHIPTFIIEKLLLEKPLLSGIALPGMPSGSPGMPGFKAGKWTIYGLNEGASSEYMVY
ncbi:MAG: DUF411 domain-containing protein [Candidatus Pacebacteria bacterium]|jgi:hypothetical protein|nr:DUF411 domain-containing protein [Candidatus Paceibacterota bacterium]MDD3072169.1 DUF411 domain-containing protein [Candidatus Paceibacterota bacterium]MDD3728766.1 DUF411 domain-containing protein [Candidatus Paceibacterota bacterium]MDD4201375.1 DUF411 domain-containing protein [Candidatus Paceibacterota bacterium]MDD4466933.1 DUF411 domain-containing protein [Candidatus Paceibacterota bacterium]